MIVKYKKLDEIAQTPKYANLDDAGMDMVAISKNETDDYIEYGTGIAMEIPSGYVGLLFPRSSVSKHDLILANCVGVVDSPYRGEIKFRFKHISTFRKMFSMIKEFIRTGEIKSHDYHISDKVGQIMIIPRPNIVLEEVQDLSDTSRGEGGFGSSGR